MQHGGGPANFPAPAEGRAGHAMNEKTAKLLKRVARHHETDAKAVKTLYKRLKDEWDRLTAEQRRKRRAVYSTLVKRA